MENLAQFISDGLFKLSNKVIAKELQKEYDTVDFFYGVKKIERRALLKQGIQRYPIRTQENYKYLINRLFNGYSQEEHFCAIDIAEAYSEYHSPDMFSIIKDMILLTENINTIDALSSRLIGPLVYKYHELEREIERWIDSPKAKMRRATLILHHKQKKQVNLLLLKFAIERLMFDSEFLVQKAIGIVLKEFSKYNPKWVEDFINSNPRLSNISRREALRHIKHGQKII